MKKLLLGFSSLILLTSCSWSELKAVGSIFKFTCDNVSYTIEYHRYTDKNITFNVSTKNDTDKKYPLFVKYGEYLDSILINNTDSYEFVHFQGYYGEIEYDSEFVMTVNLSKKGKEKFDSFCDISINSIDIAKEYIPTNTFYPIKIHYIDIILENKN